MNEAQLKIKDYMDQKISQLQSGLDKLKDRDKQPDPLGDTYNAILKCNVELMIKRLKKLEKELIEVLG